jgi:predicted kinase
MRGETEAPPLAGRMAGLVPIEHRPLLTVFTGPAGSGKSSVALAFARRHGAVYLDKDSLAGGFVGELLRVGGIDPDARDENEYYGQRVMGLEYDALLSVAGDNLRIGRHVVLDAPFARYLADASFLESMSLKRGWPAGLRVVVVQVSVPPGLRRERLRQRGLDRDTWKLENWEQHESAAPGECTWSGAHVVTFDNSGPTVDVTPLDAALGVS